MISPGPRLGGRRLRKSPKGLFAKALCHFCAQSGAATRELFCNNLAGRIQAAVNQPLIPLQIAGARAAGKQLVLPLTTRDSCDELALGLEGTTNSPGVG